MFKKLMNMFQDVIVVNVVNTVSVVHTIQWQSCENNDLQSSHDVLLVWNGEYIRYAKYLFSLKHNKCMWHDTYDHPIKGRKITHYMKIPQPPEQSCKH